MFPMGEKQKKQTGKKAESQELDALLKRRFHGAVNIRGIRYQILYSILRAFDLYAEDDGASSIRLEGIEDVYLLGLRSEDEYIQVKTSQDPWNWSQLKTPIQSFLQVYREDPDCRFVLAVDFELRTEIAKLAQLKSLPPKEKKRIEAKFRKLCSEIEATTSEADGIASRLTITSQQEKKIWEELKQTVTEMFELGSGAVDIYIRVFVARFLEWAYKWRRFRRHGNGSGILSRVCARE